MKTIECEIYVLVDSEGNYSASHDTDELVSTHENGFSPLVETDGFRIVKLRLTVSVPQVVTVSGVVPETLDTMLLEVQP